MESNQAQLPLVVYHAIVPLANMEAENRNRIREIEEMFLPLEADGKIAFVIVEDPEGDIATNVFQPYGHRLTILLSDAGIGNVINNILQPVIDGQNLPAIPHLRMVMAAGFSEFDPYSSEEIAPCLIRTEFQFMFLYWKHFFDQMTSGQSIDRADQTALTRTMADIESAEAAGSGIPDSLRSIYFAKSQPNISNWTITREEDLQHQLFPGNGPVTDIWL